MKEEIHIYKMIYSEKDNIAGDKDEKKVKKIEWYCAAVPSEIELSKGKIEYSLKGERLKAGLFFLAKSRIRKLDAVIFKVPKNLPKYFRLYSDNGEQKVVERKELNEEEIRKFSKYWK